MGCRRVPRPGEKKYVLIGDGFAQDLGPLLPAVDLVLIAPDRNLGMILESCLELLDEAKVRA